MAAFFSTKKYTIIAFVTFLLVVQTALEQEINNGNAGNVVVTGKVTDDYAKPLSGVIVYAKESHTSTITNSEGLFTIKESVTGTLIFSHPLYNVVELKEYSNIKDLTVKLSTRYLHYYSPANNLGDSINAILPKIDVLYGEQNANTILGSIATVYSNQLSTTPGSMDLYALPGRLPGLNVIQTSGFYTPVTASLTTNAILGAIPNNTSGAGPTDNSEFTVQLRGHGQSYGQAPLTIVDGVQREIYSIDPESIESISIAKDALSCILLGQNSSRGALIVTTKRPEAGPPHLSFSSEVGIQSPLKLPTPLPAYKYAYLLNEALTNDGKNAAYTANDFTAYRNGSDPIGHPNVNWYDEILKKNALITRENLDVYGGSKTARYMLSLNYMDQQGLFVQDNSNSYNTNEELKRYMVNSKVDIDVNKNFNIKLQLFGRLLEGNQPGATTSTILSNLLSTPNNAYPVYNPNGSFGGNVYYTQNLLAQVVNSGYQADNTRDVMVNLNLSYKFDNWVKGLWFKANGNMYTSSSSNINRSKQSPVFLMAVQQGDTTYNRYGNTVNQSNTFTGTGWSRYWFAQLSTGYDRTFGKSSISGQLMFDQKRVLLNYDIPSLLTNYSAKATYAYDGKYFAEGALVDGGYNRYQPGHQFGLFYAGGLGWDIAKENFLKDQHKWLNQLKLRGTYGKTGNANVDNYGYYIWRSYFSSPGLGYAIGSTYTAGVAYIEGNLANVNATWEKADKLDGGLDASLWNNHLQFSFDYYNERYYDVMQQRGKSIALIGMSYPAENIGIDRYFGEEFSITYQNNLRNFNYFVTANASVQQSKVLFMDEQYQKYSWNKQTGHPVGQRFGLIAEGFFQTDAEAQSAATISGYTPKTGDVKYKDLNGDGVIDQFDETALGKQRPLIYYGLTFGFNYKGFEFSAMIQGVQNREIYIDNSYVDAGFQSQNNTYSQAYQQILNRWIPENAATATYPRLTAGGNGYNYTPLFTSTSLFLKNGNYWRLKNVDLGYSLPYKWIKRLKLANIKVFVNAQNLYTWAKYSVVDPEVSLPNYPIQKVVNMGVNIKL